MPKLAPGGRRLLIEPSPIIVPFMLRLQRLVNSWKSGFLYIIRIPVNVVSSIVTLPDELWQNSVIETQIMNLEQTRVRKSFYDHINSAISRKLSLDLKIQKRRSLKRSNLPRSLVQSNRRSPSFHTSEKFGRRIRKKSVYWAYH